MLRSGAGLPSGEGSGLGWRDGGQLDRMRPGAALAGFLGRAAGEGLRGLDDGELVGVLLGWRRLGSWAAVGELAAVSELVRRRHEQVETSGDDRWFQHVDDEVAAALRLTKHGANRLLEEAWDLERLPGTAAALAEGRIDRWKARVIGSETTGLDGEHAAAVEAAGRPVPGRSDGGIAGDDRSDSPRSADRGGQGPRASAGWEFARPVPGWVNLTMPLASLLGGSDEPGEVTGFGPVTSADARHIAEAIAGDPRSRWCVTVTGPGGRAVAHGCARHRPRRPSGPRGNDPGPPPGAGGNGPGAAPGRGGHVPGPAPGPGAENQRPPPNPGGNDVRPPPGPGDGERPSPGPGWQLAVEVQPLAAGDCDHVRESAGYRPSAPLRHVIRIRQPQRTFPGCRRAAARCDEDHTVPYHQGGRTCECNLAPLCRRHHQAKQAPGWRLEQPRPGHMIWTSPAGRTYPVI